MKWFRNHCSRREDASLLAANVLNGGEKITAERHLAECAECRAYYNELKELAAPLAEWEKSYSFVEPTQAMRARWTNAIEQGTTTPSRATFPAGFLRTVWRELIWPSRYAWSGLAALWLAMLLVNAQLSDHSTGKNSLSPQEIMQAWQEQRRVFVDWDRPSIVVRAAPAWAPRPRSERDENWAVI